VNTTMPERKRLDDGTVVEHKELRCLVCAQDRGVEVTVDNTADKLAHEREFDHAYWSEDWTGHWREIEPSEMDEGSEDRWDSSEWNDKSWEEILEEL